MEVDDEDIHKICSLLVANGLPYASDQDVFADAGLVGSLFHLTFCAIDAGDEPVHLAVWMILSHTASLERTNGS